MQSAITQDMTNQVMQRLDALAAKLGVTAQYIYGVYVQQARVEAIRDSIAGALLLVGSVVSFYLCYRIVRWAWKSVDDEMVPLFGAFLLAIIGVVILIIGITCFYEALGEWMNPQFWAIDALFKAIGGVK